MAANDFEVEYAAVCNYVDERNGLPSSLDESLDESLHESLDESLPFWCS